MTIGEKLRLFGKRNFSNTTEFAKSLGMTQPSLSLYLNGHREPGTGILRRLMALGCDLNWLLSEKEDVVEITITRAGEPNEPTEQERISALQAEIKLLRSQIEAAAAAFGINIEKPKKGLQKN